MLIWPDIVQSSKMLTITLCFCRLIDVLRDFGKIDWQLAAMVCQTLWNYG
jgi:hypothetical protein